MCTSRAPVNNIIQTGIEFLHIVSDHILHRPVRPRKIQWTFTCHRKSSVHQSYQPSYLVMIRFISILNGALLLLMAGLSWISGQQKSIRTIKLFPDVDRSLSPDKRNGTVVFSIEGSNDVSVWNTIVNPASASWGRGIFLNTIPVLI